MKKVLIVSSPFFGYQESVGRAFEELGWKIKIETYDEPVHPFRGWLKWKHKFSRNKEAIKSSNRKEYAKYIEKVFDSFQPDLVFSYNGTILLNSTLDKWRKTARVIFWMYDSVLRDDRENCRTHIDHSDAVFCFENKDVEYYASIGKTAYFLPLACDTTVYFPTNINGPKDIDILFVGTIYTSQKRKAILEKVVCRYPQLKIRFYGQYKPFVKNPLTWFFRRHRKQFLNYNIPPADVNSLFGRCRIALNIHHTQSTFGANQRLYEASGAGAYQICDYNPYIASVFQKGEIGLYHNENELFSLIDYALTHDMSSNAKAAYDIVISEHNFKSRICAMLNVINHQIN